MVSEIQEQEILVYPFTVTQIRELDTIGFHNECIHMVRQAFIAHRDSVPLFTQFNSIWIDRVHRILLEPIQSSLVFPLQITIPSSSREFFRFPRKLVLEINKGIIQLGIQNNTVWDLFVLHLEKSLESNLKIEILSWFYPIWKDIDLCPLLPADLRQGIEASALYNEWLMAFRLRHPLAGSMSQPARLIFRFKAAALVKEFSPGRDSAGGKKSRAPLHRLLYYRCRYQKEIRNLKKASGRMLRIWIGKISWQRYSLPVFSLGVLFFTMILSHYGHSLPFIKSELDPGKQKNRIYPELTTARWLMDDPGREDVRLAGRGSVMEISGCSYDKGQLQGIFWNEKEFSNRLFLTFDDGPNLDRVVRRGKDISVTAGLLDILKEKGIKAVFFINGKQLSHQSIRRDRELRLLLNRMIREGHLIGNHSYHHDNLNRGVYQDGLEDRTDIQEEFNSTQRELDRILGFRYPLILIRPPYAEPGRSSLLDRILIDEKEYLISLQFDSYDYAYREDGYWQLDSLFQHVQDLILPSRGGVLLMHDKASSLLLLEEILNDPEINSQMDFSGLSDILLEKYGQ